MLEPDAAHPVRQREQEVVVVEVLRAEQPIRLLHEVAVRLDLLVRRRELIGAVREQVQPHGPRGAGVEIDEPIVLAGEQRRVDERLEVRLGEARRVAARRGTVERNGEPPTLGQLDARRDADA